MKRVINPQDLDNLRNIKIVIIGAGPVGLVLAFKLKNMGFDVVILEKCPEESFIKSLNGRSVNITLSKRGLDVLKGIECYLSIFEMGQKVIGRNYLTDTGDYFLPYTKILGKYLISIQRSDMIRCLYDQVNKSGVKVIFNSQITEIDIINNQVQYNGGLDTLKYDFLFGTDGVNSIIRDAVSSHNNCIQSHDYGYKKIEISASEAINLGFNANAVNILNGDGCILLSLPNTDGSHSGLLHAKKDWFSKIQSKEQFKNCLVEEFTKVIPNAYRQFIENPLGEFKSVECANWYKNDVLLMGDAAHACVPFYGQGTNAGLEDVDIFTSLVEKYEYDLHDASWHFQKTRPEDTNAIIAMSERNLKAFEHQSPSEFQKYLKMKNIELDMEFNNRSVYHSEYYQIAFTNLPYSEVQNLSKQRALALVNKMKKGFGRSLSA